MFGIKRKTACFRNRAGLCAPAELLCAPVDLGARASRSRPPARQTMSRTASLLCENRTPCILPGAQGFVRRARSKKGQRGGQRGTTEDRPRGGARGVWRAAQGKKKEKGKVKGDRLKPAREAAGAPHRQYREPHETTPPGW